MKVSRALLVAEAGLLSAKGFHNLRQFSEDDITDAVRQLKTLQGAGVGIDNRFKYGLSIAEGVLLGRETSLEDVRKSLSLVQELYDLIQELME